MKVTTKNNKNIAPNEDNNILRMLDRGIDDMEAGRELPLKDAFQKISELRYLKNNYS